MKIIEIDDISEIPENFTGITVFPDGTKWWYKEGKLHREDGPAIENSDGTKAWYKEGKRHREDGPAIEHKDGTKYWYKEDKYHRLGGPAIEYIDGTKLWCKEGNYHREDGPACKYSNGYKEWWLEHEEYIKINLSDYLVLDYFEGKYGLMWYRLLDKNQILEYPDIPGLITK